MPRIDRYDEAWQALVDAPKLGLIKSIGVSNLLPEHLDKIIETTGVVPTINQIERHPSHYNNKTSVEDNQKQGVLVESQSTVGRNLNDLEILDSLDQGFEGMVEGQNPNIYE